MRSIARGSARACDDDIDAGNIGLIVNKFLASRMFRPGREGPQPDHGDRLYREVGPRQAGRAFLRRIGFDAKGTTDDEAQGQPRGRLRPS